MSKFVVALVGVALMAVVASWEILLFVGMRDPSGLNAKGDRTHLWLAAIACVTACVAAGLMFRFFSRHEKNKWSKVVMTPTGPRLSILGGNPFINSPSLFDAKRWSLGNAWLSEGQADDRMPMDGSVQDRGETPPGQRSFARRTHQLMFKKWSQARHD